MNKERVSHGSTITTDYFRVIFDNKEFNVDLIKKERYFKDHNPPIEFKVTQIPSQEDELKALDLVEKEMNIENKEIQKR